MIEGELKESQTPGISGSINEKLVWGRVYHYDRRRSYRVLLGSGIPLRLQGMGDGRMVELSLWGCLLETHRRIPTGSLCKMEFDYKDAQTEVGVRAYQSFLHELFYSESGQSVMRIRSRALFVNPSIPILNSLYRIMADYWSAAEDASEGRIE